MAAKKPSKDRRTKPGVWEERFSEYKQEILKLAILGVPLAILDSVSGRISDRFLDQPWQAIVFLIPIAALGALFMRRAARADSLRIDRRTLLVLGAYILFFSVAAETRVLDWSRAPALFGQPSDRHWLLPVAWGDWRYRLVKKVDGDEIVVVLRDPTAGKTREQARAELVTVMGLAASKGAKGIAFDYYFDRESALDDLLCATVNTIGKPVVFGYGFQLAQERMTALPVPPSLQGCITPERPGHLVGFRDADYRARVIPLYFNNDHQRPALSLRLAQAISGDTPVSPPDAGLLQFIEPARPYAQVRLADLLDPSTEHEADRNLLHDRFVLVAEDSVKDSFDTPSGRTPGGIIHANAAHSLLRGHYIRDGPRWVGFVSMLAFCFGLAVWCANGVPVARLVLVCIVATACFWAIAIAGILTGPQWFDAVYPTAAVWLLLPLLLALRRVTARRSTRTAAARVDG
jgi:CHASE2 domain-containing sensor protein